MAGRPEVRSLKHQVQTDFVTAYATSAEGRPPQAPEAPAWTGGDSVFALWIGINDVGNSYYHGPGVTDGLNAQIMAVYRAALDTLYAAGARHFVLLNVPPVDRSPLMLGQDAAARALERADLEQWNGLVDDLAAGLRADHPGEAAVWVYDAHAAFAAVLDAPAARPETAGYKNTTAFCTAYEKYVKFPPRPLAAPSSCQGTESRRTPYCHEANTVVTHQRNARMGYFHAELRRARRRVLLAEQPAPDVPHA